MNRKWYYLSFAILFLLYSSYWFVFAAIHNLPLTMILSGFFGIGFPIAVYFDYIKDKKKRS